MKGPARKKKIETEKLQVFAEEMKWKEEHTVSDDIECTNGSLDSNFNGHFLIEGGRNLGTN